MENETCTVANCDKKIRCQGKCQYHYHRAWVAKTKANPGLKEGHTWRNTGRQDSYYEGLWEFVKKELRIPDSATRTNVLLTTRYKSH